MAVVVSNVIPGSGPDLYEQVTAKLGIGDQLPEGCRVHIAGPANEGWRIITVWESPEDFARFRDERLVPAIQEVAGANAPTPQPDIQDVHTLITA